MSNRLICNYINSPVPTTRTSLDLPFQYEHFLCCCGDKDTQKSRDLLSRQYTCECWAKNLEEQAIKLLVWMSMKNIRPHNNGHSLLNYHPLSSSVYLFDWPMIHHYFNDRYQRVQIGGLQYIERSCWKESRVELNTDFFADQGELGGFNN